MGESNTNLYILLLFFIYFVVSTQSQCLYQADQCNNQQYKFYTTDPLTFNDTYFDLTSNQTLSFNGNVTFNEHTIFKIKCDLVPHDTQSCIRITSNSSIYWSPYPQSSFTSLWIDLNMTNYLNEWNGDDTYAHIQFHQTQVTELYQPDPVFYANITTPSNWNCSYSSSPSYISLYVRCTKSLIVYKSTYLNVTLSGCDNGFVNDVYRFATNFTNHMQSTYYFKILGTPGYWIDFGPSSFYLRVYPSIDSDISDTIVNYFITNNDTLKKLCEYQSINYKATLTLFEPNFDVIPSLKEIYSVSLSSTKELPNSEDNTPNSSPTHHQQKAFQLIPMLITTLVCMVCAYSF